MRMSGNTILITGGGSGIGRALARALHAAGNKIIVAGRRRDALEETVAACPGMEWRLLDVGDAAAIAAFASTVVADFPGLDVLVNNAGVMRAEDVLAGGVADAEATIATNLLGPIRLTAALMPHFLARPSAAVINVTSGLAFIPLAATPTYSATKAALHSYSQSLRFQLRDTSVDVIELPPPMVATELMAGQSENPHAMPLADYVDEVMTLLAADPAATEILVERVKPLRYAERGDYAKIFAALNGRH